MKNGVEILSKKSLNKNLNCILIIFLIALLQLFILIFRTKLIGNLIDQNSIKWDILSQWNKVEILTEPLNEGIVLVLFSMICLSLNQKKSESTYKIGFWFTFFCYSLIALILTFSIKDYLGFFFTKIASEEPIYFELMIWNKVITAVLILNLALLVATKSYKAIYWNLLLRIVLIIALDLVFINVKIENQTYAGLGLSLFLSSLICLSISFIFVILNLTDKNIFKIEKIKFNKTALKNMTMVFIESCLRNMFFLFLISYYISMFSQTTTLWIINTIFWNLILIPTVNFYKFEKYYQTNHGLIKRKFVMLSLVPIFYFLLLTLIMLFAGNQIINWFTWPDQHFTKKAMSFFVILSGFYFSQILNELIGGITKIGDFKN
ncbi:hypothetical protein SCLARK_00994 [Spiroplasma clarkii]|uniref:hypothetical protein n=1 Tax=Spiroplasma clarkii TaxID=2139 RepID=UPI000B570000|nr:hypothetical protein [Spiroplasma clarkii]ARU91587.1 hypothetical protein SCLARK_00994 [Spiroplasma clarkii]